MVRFTGISILKIVNKDFDVQQVDINNRLFTVLTSLNKGLRPFLRYKSEPLMNIDIKNSQPFMFNMILRDSFKHKAMPLDVQLYINLTSAGTFYEHLMKLLNVPIEDRDWFKKDFFGKIYYCTEHYAKRTPEGQMFIKEFPNVVNVMNEYKSMGKNHLPVLMQEYEAKMILQKVVIKLAAKRIWCSTVHDSVICRIQDAETVKTIINDLFEMEYQLSPKLSSEYLQPIITELKKVA